MVCLDTSVLVALIRKEDRAIKELKSEAVKGGRVSTTIMNLCELYAGAYASINPVRELERVQGIASRLEILELSISASRRYGELANHPKIRAYPIGDFDLIIACIALSHGESVATRNVDHFSRVPGLVVERW